MSHTVDIPKPVKDSLRKFRFSTGKTGSAALVFRVDKTELVIKEVKKFDLTSIEDLIEELPEHAPRFIILSYEYHHKDGRTSFPLIFINWKPQAETALMTLHASASLDFQTAADVSKVIEATGPEELTTEVLHQKLSTL